MEDPITNANEQRQPSDTSSLDDSDRNDRASESPSTIPSRKRKRSSIEHSSNSDEETERQPRLKAARLQQSDLQASAEENDTERKPEISARGFGQSPLSHGFNHEEIDGHLTDDQEDSRAVIKKGVLRQTPGGGETPAAVPPLNVVEAEGSSEDDAEGEDVGDSVDPDANAKREEDSMSWENHPPRFWLLIITLVYKKSALDLLSQIEKDFATFRDK